MRFNVRAFEIARSARDFKPCSLCASSKTSTTTKPTRTLPRLETTTRLPLTTPTWLTWIGKRACFKFIPPMHSVKRFTHYLMDILSVCLIKRAHCWVKRIRATSTFISNPSNAPLTRFAWLLPKMVSKSDCRDDKQSWSASHCDVGDARPDDSRPKREALGVRDLLPPSGGEGPEPSINAPRDRRWSVG